MKHLLPKKKSENREDVTGYGCRNCMSYCGDSCTNACSAGCSTKCGGACDSSCILTCGGGAFESWA